MSILSTSSRLIKVGQDYSAGSGISIDNHVISVTSVPGTTYSAGDNITIEDNVINSKDWSQDIADASANAYNEATAQIPAPFDPSYISGQVDNKLDSTAFTSWQAGQYTTDLQTIEGQIGNKLDESAFSAVSGSFLTAINIPESATWNEVSQAYENASGTYLTSVSIPESATWQDVSTTVQSNSAQWSDNTGDEEVNSFVYNNSATINDVNSSYQTNSGNFLTALPEDLVYTEDLTGYLSTSSTGGFGTSANIAVVSGINRFGMAERSVSLYPNKIVFTSASDIPPVQIEINAGSINNWNSNYNTVTSNSSNWNDITAYQTNSASYLTAHQDISYKLDESAFADVSGTFLTAINIPESANWEEATQAYEQNSGTYLTAHQSLDGYATEDWVTGQGYITGVEIPESATWNEVSTTVQTNSSNWDDVSNKLDTTSFSDVSGTFLTAHQDLSDYYTTAEANTLSSMFSGAIDYVSANAGDQEVNNLVHTNSASWGTVSDKLDSSAIGIRFSVNNVVSSISGLRISAWTAGNASYATRAGLDGDGNSFTTAYAKVSALNDKLDTTAFSTVSGDFLTAINIPESANWNDTTNVVQTNSADWASHQDLSYISGVVDNKLDESAFANVSGTFLTAHQSLDGYATENWVTGQGYITGVDLSEYAKTSSVLDYIDSACSSKLDTTSFSNVSGDFLTTSFGISESAHWEEATNAYEQASGTYLTSHQDLSDYQTIEGMTAYQPVGDYYSASNPSGFITGVDLTPYATTAEVDTLSSMLSGAIDYVSANAGDEFPASANEAITAYQNASGTYLTAISIPESATWNDVSTTVQTNSSNWDNVTNKLDTTSFSTVSGDFLTAVDLTPYQTIEGMTAYQPVGDYATTGDLALKQDTLNFGYDEQDRINSINSSALAGGVDVTSPLGTISVDGSNIEATNSAVGPIITPAASALLGDGISINGTLERPTLFNFTLPTSGGTLYAVRTMFALTNKTFNFSGKDLNGNIATGTMTYPGEIGTYTADLGEIVSNISAQDNEPGPVYVNQLYVTSPETSSIGVRELAWKSEIPTGVMVESACEYNAVNEISAYNGSAIAQYGAEKQWLVHDDTLVHLSNSAQYALGVNVSALQRLMGIDETVLWSGDAYTGSTAINLSEPTTAFTKIQFWNKTEQLYELGSNFPNGYAYLRYAPYELPGASACKILDVSLGVNTSNYMNLTYQFNKIIGPIHYATSTANKGVNYYYNVGDNDSHIVKIIGIGRKQ